MSRVLAPFVIDLDTRRAPGEDRLISFHKNGVEIAYIDSDFNFVGVSQTFSGLSATTYISAPTFYILGDETPTPLFHKMKLIGGVWTDVGQNATIPF